METRVDAARTDGGQRPAADPGWNAVDARVRAYLRACGVTDPKRLEELSAEVARSLDRRTRSDDDRGARAVAEAVRVVDDWLVAGLGIGGDPPDADQVISARAALLGGQVSVGRDRILDEPSGELVAALRSTMPRPVPAAAPLPMERQRIDLRRGPIALILQALRRLLRPAHGA
ncbi:MAG: hypothetical protein AB7Q97_13445 [Gammaproteobacteria bacterium]